MKGCWGTKFSVKIWSHKLHTVSEEAEVSFTGESDGHYHNQVSHLNNHQRMDRLGFWTSSQGALRTSRVVSLLLVFRIIGRLSDRLRFCKTASLIGSKMTLSKRQKSHGNLLETKELWQLKAMYEPWLESGSEKKHLYIKLRKQLGNLHCGLFISWES